MNIQDLKHNLCCLLIFLTADQGLGYLHLLSQSICLSILPFPKRFYYYLLYCCFCSLVLCLNPFHCPCMELFRKGRYRFIEFSFNMPSFTLGFLIDYYYNVFFSPLVDGIFLHCVKRIEEIKCVLFSPTFWKNFNKLVNFP